MPGGRPPMYETAEEMQSLVDKYFTDCKATYSLDVKEFPTITGLALALGFNSRQSLLNYEGKPQFMDTIKTAKARVECFIEQRLYQGQATGCIFNLKNNFGWKDKTEQELSGSVGLLGNLMGEIDGTTAGIPRTES